YLLFCLSLGISIQFGILDELESFSGNSGSRWTSDHNGIDLLLSVALGFEKGSIVSLPVFIDSTSFDMILIEEVSNITQSRNTLHISIKGNDSIISFLDRLILSSDVYLYCLASNKQDCPSHFQVIQSLKEIRPRAKSVLYRPLNNKVPLTGSMVKGFMNRRHERTLILQIISTNCKTSWNHIWSVVLLILSVMFILLMRITKHVKRD
ncbi:hypothetical protein WA171_003643, partial [Blastocystis sp. BT1]